jgi:predicted RNA-binding protein YlxR (DUF448 family)
MTRLVRGDDGRVRVDRRQRERGRGAYVCPSAACFEAALTRRRLGHAFRCATEPPVETGTVMRDILGQEGRTLWRDG